MDNDTPNTPPHSDQNEEHTQLRQAFQDVKENASKEEELPPAKATGEREDESQSSKPHPGKPGPSKPNYSMDANPMRVDDERELSPDDIRYGALNFTNATISELKGIDDNLPNIGLGAGEEGLKWGYSYLEARENSLNGDVLVESLSREDSNWSQKVPYEGDRIGPGRPRFGSSQGGVISGERAILKTSAALGLGSMVQIPLWRSGLWVSLKAPSESSLLELERRIANEKVSLGRATSGMLFSNTSVYTMSYMVNFALQHVYDASVRDVSPENLKRLIKSSDIPVLIWGLACTVYPKGYDFARPCTNDPVECQHVINGTLDLGKMLFTDTDMLSDWQKRLMVRRNDKFTDDELARYQAEHIRGNERRVHLNDILSVVLRIPTINEYEVSGFKWVDGVVEMLESSLGTSLKGDQRNAYIKAQAKLTALRQYTHWVKEVQVDEDVIEDRETLEQFIGTLSSSEEISNAFLEEVGKYIDDSVTSVVAIPRFKCPMCDATQEADVWDGYHPYLLPIDVIQTFFTLLGQRLRNAISRERTVV